jgi:hypothetical protein
VEAKKLMLRNGSLGMELRNGSLGMEAEDWKLMNGS